MTRQEWDFAIERNRSALVQIIAALCALVGLDTCNMPSTFSRALRTHIFRQLRPAESAARRLIYALVGDARRIKIDRVEKQDKNTLAPARCTGILPATEKPARPPLFKLFDTPKQFDFQAGPKYARNPPRIFFFNGNDRPPERKIEHVRDGQHAPTAKHIIRRIAALKRALDDLPSQAQRMARAIKQRYASGPKPNSSRLMTPLRPGYPPGYHQRVTEPVDDVLKNCIWIAREKIP